MQVRFLTLMLVLCCTLSHRSLAHADPGGEDVNGIPEQVAAAVRLVYTDPHGGTDKQTITQRNSIYAKLRPTIAEFDKRWREYLERKQLVDAAIGKAASADHAAGRAALSAVITAVPAGGDGRIDPKKREILESRDAEIAAVDAYVKLLIADNDWQPAVEAGAMYWTRRRVKDDKGVELWYFLAAKHDKLIGELGSDNLPGLRADIQKYWNESGHIRGAQVYEPEGTKLAYQYEKMLAKSGLDWTVVNVEGGKKGQWIQVKLEPSKVTDKTVEYSGNEEWRVPKNCTKTNRIEFWDGLGNPVYAEQCEYDYFERKITFSAQLRAPLPAWAKGRDTLTVVGKIVSTGPTWKLVDAFIADRRFGEHDF